MDRFLKRALELAEKKSVDGRHGPFGAVIVKDGRIIAEGWNEVVAKHDPTAHAEVMAIRAACAALVSHDLCGCTLYASCEPCPMCLAAIYWARIDRVVFAAERQDAADAGFDDELFYRELVLPPDARRIAFEQASAEEGRRVLAQWLANPHRVPY